MPNILELLKNEKVEWKKLGELATIQRGRVISKKYLESHKGEYPVYSSQTKDDGVIGKIESYDFDGEYITWTTDGAYAGTVFYRLGKFSITNICGLIKPKDELMVKYLYYWLQIKAKRYVTGGSGNPKLMSNVAATIEIPIPSLDTQEKIVKILDKFSNSVSELQIELQTELQSRTKQYNYYRDMLLSEVYLNKITKEMEEDRKLRIEKLGNVCDLKRGKRLVKNELQEEGVFPVYQNSIIPLGYYHESNFNGDKTFIISAGSAGEIVYSYEDFWAADDVYVLNTQENILNKYLYYFLMSKQYIIKSKVRKASVPRLSKEDIEKITITIPPISLQNKIVKILDKFQMILEDTKGLLPEEIEQRQKQYEYYREKLLTFDKYCDSTHARTLILSNHYYDILEEASKFVEVDIEDKVEWEKLKTITKDVENINWKMVDRKLQYIDLSSVNIKNKKIESTELITKSNAPSRAKQIVKSKDIIFGTTRPMQERLALIPDSLNNHICSTGYCVLRANKKIVKEKWVYFNLLKRDFYKYVELNQKGASYPAISDSKIKNYKIPLPPIHVQQHIVSILDKFNTLVNDIKEGLPKEIELRQKQYEYWREQLLSFNR